MSDAADMADAIQAETIDIAVRAARNAILPGISGECDGCEWWMPRLVDGLCGFCRDGRPRPPDWEPPPRPDPVTIDPPVKVVTMAKTPTSPIRKPDQPVVAPKRLSDAAEPLPIRKRLFDALDAVAALAAEALDRPDAVDALAASVDRATKLEAEAIAQRERADALQARLDALKGLLAA